MHLGRTSYTTSRCWFIIVALLQFASHLFAFTVARSLVHAVCLIQVEVVARALPTPGLVRRRDLADSSSRGAMPAPAW
uniref:Uncharacterized protein n=1 Tax=Arundo donax TaxID=35708 RepID=A0A0A8ZCE6_ARUDO